MEDIKAGDWVVALGEANECWQVERIDRHSLYTMVVLKEGDAEPIDKCKRVRNTASIHKKMDGRHFCDQYPFMNSEVVGA